MVEFNEDINECRISGSFEADMQGVAVNDRIVLVVVADANGFTVKTTAKGDQRATWVLKPIDVELITSNEIRDELVRVLGLDGFETPVDLNETLSWSQEPGLAGYQLVGAPSSVPESWKRTGSAQTMADSVPVAPSGSLTEVPSALAGPPPTPIEDQGRTSVRPEDERHNEKTMGDKVLADFLREGASV